MSVVDDELAEVLSADTFLVVGQYNSVEGMIEGVVGEIEEPIKKVVVVGCIIFKIETVNLMTLRDDADLSGSRVLREEKTARGDVKAIEEFEEGLAVMIIPDEAGESRSNTEGSEAAGDVSSTARGGLTPIDFSDRNGRVGRELIEASEVELIEHDITEDEDTALGGGTEGAREGRTRHKKSLLDKSMEMC